jgi:5-methylcytosine-specific restriction endonuclease McrA
MKRKPYKYTKEILEKEVEKVTSYAGLIRNLGRNQSGGLQYHLKTLIDYYEIDVSHFKRQAWNKGCISEGKHSKESFINKVLVKDGAGWHSDSIKKRIIELGLKEHKCESCGITEWLGHKAPIHLDHINGDRFDNRIENLRILCPNCHALTPTYGGKNINR